MRLSQLPLVSDRERFVDPNGNSVYIFSIVILALRNGKQSWRGLGQFIPNGTTLLCTANIVFVGDSDANGEWPLNIWPVAVQVGDVGSFGKWEKTPFEDHEINWSSDGHSNVVAAQFCKPRHFEFDPAKPAKLEPDGEDDILDHLGSDEVQLALSPAGQFSTDDPIADARQIACEEYVDEEEEERRQRKDDEQGSER